MDAKTRYRFIDKTDIILKWLSIPENRRSLPQCTLNKSDFECLIKNGKTYRLWGPDEVVYEVNGFFYNLKCSE